MVVSILYGLIIILGTLTNLTMLFAFFTNKVLTVRSPKKITYENKEHNHAICVQCRFCWPPAMSWLPTWPWLTSSCPRPPSPWPWWMWSTSTGPWVSTWGGCARQLDVFSVPQCSSRAPASASLLLIDTGGLRVLHYIIHPKLSENPKLLRE